MTGLPNFIAVVEKPERVLGEGRKGLVALDIIDMLGLNETWGRDVGDRVLKTLSDVLVRSANDRPKQSVVYRIGGDEFLLALQDEPPAKIKSFLQDSLDEFRESLSDQRLPTVDVRYVMTFYPDEVDSLPRAFARLHRMLYYERGDERAVDLDDPHAWADALAVTLFRRFNETVRELRRTEELALTDAISGLPNHRAAEADLNRMIHEWSFSGTEFGVLFVDGDNLKAYNDIGYETGNEMIRHLARVLQQAVRSEDRVYRWLSGDEFLVILPATSRSLLARVAERVRLAVRAAFKSWPIPITVSIGMAVFPHDGETSAALIKKATLANAKAKRAGKDKVC